MDPAAKQAFENGMTLARAGDPAAAAGAFTEAVNREPTWLMARLNRGSAWFLAKNFPAAIADFDAVLAADQTSPDVYLNRSVARRAVGDHAGADADLARAVEIAPDNLAVLNTRGAERLRTGDAPGAAADFTRVLEGNPDHVPTRVARATARLHMLDFAGAVGDCGDALRVEPKNREALITRASARMMQQQFAEAMADVTVLLDAEPTSPEILYLRGVARVGLEKYAEALADLNEVVKRAPQLAAGWAARGNAKYHLGDATAAADYREAFKIDPTSSTRVLLRLVRDQQRHKLTQVLAECQAFRAKDRSDGISLARRGLTRLFQGRAADANLDFAAFRKLMPGDVGILDALIAAATKAVAEKKR